MPSGNQGSKGNRGNQGNQGNQGGNQGKGRQGDTSNRGFASMDPQTQREIASEAARRRTKRALLTNSIPRKLARPGARAGRPARAVKASAERYSLHEKGCHVHPLI
jgi:hypothetical protein